MKARIRDMEVADAGAVSELLGRSWRRTYEPLIGVEKTEAGIASRFSEAMQTREAEDDNVIALVAEREDGSICGCAMASMDASKQAWLDRMHVEPDCFGSGLADNLLHALLLKHTGLPSLSLVVIKGNDRAIAFYSRHGFAIVGERPDCGDLQGVPSVEMSKILHRA